MKRLLLLFMLIFPLVLLGAGKINFAPGGVLKFAPSGNPNYIDPFNRATVHFGRTGDDATSIRVNYRGTNYSVFSVNSSGNGYIQYNAGYIGSACILIHRDNAYTDGPFLGIGTMSANKRYPYIRTYFKVGRLPVMGGADSQQFMFSSHYIDANAHTDFLLRRSLGNDEIVLNTCYGVSVAASFTPEINRWYLLEGFVHRRGAVDTYGYSEIWVDGAQLATGPLTLVWDGLNASVNLFKETVSAAAIESLDMSIDEFTYTTSDNGHYDQDSSYFEWNEPRGGRLNFGN